VAREPSTNRFRPVPAGGSERQIGATHMLPGQAPPVSPWRNSQI
jgi:hypothetical protein